MKLDGHKTFNVGMLKLILPAKSTRVVNKIKCENILIGHNCREHGWCWSGE